jgi:hypothetical protein
VAEYEIIDIDDDESLYRRLLNPLHVYETESGQRVKPEAYRLSNKADPDISTKLASRVTVEDASFHPKYPGAGCGEFPVTFPRHELGLEVQHTPCDEGGPWHCSVRGIQNLANPREACARLAKATIVVKPAIRDGQ